MNSNEIDDILRNKASEESASWRISPQIDEKILREARTGGETARNDNRVGLYRRLGIPVLAGAVLCVCLALFVLPGQPKAPVMEKDCLQFYARLTKAINDKDIEQIASSYDNRSVGMKKGEMRSRLESLFAKYDSIDYRPGAIKVIAEGSHAVILSAFELTAVSREGPVSMTGTDRIYLRRTRHDIKVSLWVSE
jgi:hypothetical protein